MKKSCFLIMFSLLGTSMCLAQKPSITPAWAFSHIVWEDSINTRQAAERLVREYKQHDIPVDAIIIDSPWTTSYNDFTWDEGRYPQPLEMLKGFDQQGVRTILWTTGNINDQDNKGDTSIGHNANLPYVQAKGFAVDDGQIYHWWKGEGVHIDFTNKKAVKWWNSQMDKVFTQGVYGWKVDQGEFWLGETVKTSKGTMPQERFRPYYYDAMYDYTRKKNDEAIIIARPYSHQGGLAASVDKVQMGWCGDFSGNWDGIRQQLDNIYQSAQNGYAAVAMEVAGFFKGRSTKEEFVRYYQIGCMTACMINGGENGAFSNHLPWWYDDQVTKGYRFCVNLHRQLAPYKFSTVVDAHLNGGSLIKNSSIEEMSHQVGNDIFTKAFVSNDNNLKFHLPKDGTWVDFWNGKEFKGGTEISQQYTLDEFPLYVRKGAIIPMTIDNTVTGIGDASMTGKKVFYIVPDGLSSRTLHLPVSSGTAYFDCSISYDAAKRQISVKSKNNIDAVFIVKDVGTVAATGKTFVAVVR